MTENISLIIQDIQQSTNNIESIEQNNKLIDDEIASMFELGKKKKKSKEKKEKKNEQEVKYHQLETPPTYTYNELLTNLYNQLGDLAIKENQKFMIYQPIVVKITIKKVLWTNFNETCIAINRNPEHLFLYTINELNTQGSFNENKQLIIKGKYHSKNIENILRKYVCSYVQCSLCRSYETIITKDSTLRLQYLICNSCKGSKTIPSLKSINKN